MTKQNLKDLVVFTSGRFGAIFLEEIFKKNLKPSLVVTKEDKPKGRKRQLSEVPAKIIAKNFGLKILSPSSLNDSLFLKTLKKHREGLFLVADYGKIIPEKIINLPKYKMLNIHPSLLPKSRGPTPIQSTILKGEATTGVTLHLVSEKIEAGDIIAPKAIKLSGK